MSLGRPRTPIGAHGSISTRRSGDRVVARTAFRDIDGRTRKVTASAPTAAAAKRRLMERLANRPAVQGPGVLRATSSFTVLAELWLTDLDARDLSANTKDNYRTILRLHVLPAFEHYAISEVTTGRVEWFLTRQAKVSASRAKHARMLLNLLFAFALRHDAVSRNPVEGTSPLRQSKAKPTALTIDQIAAIRAAAAQWRSDPGLPGPRPDGQVRDIIEVLLGTAMRPGEVLALRPCDIDDRPGGMIATVRGTVVQLKGAGSVRQSHPKTDASVRRIPVPEFAAVVIRRRLGSMGPRDRERTIFRNRSGAPLSTYNVRRTFREFLALADLKATGISLRWYRRTGATVIARGMGTDAAAGFLGHTSSVITEGHYIQPDTSIDPTPATHLERTLRPDAPDGTLLAMDAVAGEAALIRRVERERDDPGVE